MGDTITGPAAPEVESVADRAVRFCREAGVDLTGWQEVLVRRQFTRKPFLLIDGDDVYPVDSPYAVAGAVHDADGLVTVVCLDDLIGGERGGGVGDGLG